MVGRRPERDAAPPPPGPVAIAAYDCWLGYCMVDRMEKRKATFLLSAHTLDAAKAVVPDGGMSAFVDRALRNETLRTQLAVKALPELGRWLDDAETDQAPAA